ncbi:hypothetical protein MTR67_034388, partial [Solanum verrucosum]
EEDGVCRDVRECQNRLRTSFGCHCLASVAWAILIFGVPNIRPRYHIFTGSSKHMGPLKFRGHFSNNETANPDLFNWNKIMVAYCDGGAFTGDVERVDPVLFLPTKHATIYQNATLYNHVTIRYSSGNYETMIKTFGDWYIDRQYYYLIDKHDLQIP